MFFDTKKFLGTEIVCQGISITGNSFKKISDLKKEKHSNSRTAVNY